MVMLAEYGSLSLADVLGPSLQMAEGYAIEAQASQSIEGQKDKLKQWPYSRSVMLPNFGEEFEAPKPGEIFRQKDLAKTLQRLIDAEAEALAAGKSRQAAIYAAYDRFYRGDIAEEIVRGTQEQGGLITMEDLDQWQVYQEEPAMTTYSGIEVYKLTSWVQGPVMLQALNMLENFDLKAMGYNSTRYIHTLYQVMNMAFADRDFYYGDPYYPPAEPLEGLLSKEYAKSRSETIDWEQNNPDAKPGDPYPLPGRRKPVPPLSGRVDTGSWRRDQRRWLRGRLLRRHHLDSGCRQRRMGCIGDAQRRVDTGSHRRQDRHRPQSKDAELCAGPGRESL